MVEKPEIIFEDTDEPFVYEMRILKGFKAIGQSLGQSLAAARRWEKEGAPITRGDDGIPRAEKGTLWRWYQRQNRG